MHAGLAMLPSHDVDDLNQAGRYRLLEAIGRGGMSTVYRAAAPDGSIVAIKILRAGLGVHGVLAPQLRHERSVLAQIDHPNVEHAIDDGSLEDGTPFVVLELARGESLVRLARGGPLSLARVAAIGRQLLAAVGAVHAAGFVHGDIKSANVVVDSTATRDVIKLVDFGLASAPGTSGNAGTPSYMAPELIAGGSPTHASDIYAIGIVLYEMLTGRPPFAGSTVRELLLRQSFLIADPPSSRRSLDDLSPQLDALILRVLAKDPAARPVSCAALARAFDAAIDLHPDRDELAIRER
jgi:serine/threonine-protein kinase